MQSNSCHEMIPLIISTFMLYFLLFSPVFTSSALRDFQPLNKTFMPRNELKKMKLINALLKKINKPFVKSIKSSDGDIIDCVLFNLQPAFDHSDIKEKMSWDPPELPKGHDSSTKMKTEIIQLWSSKGKSCPNGTIPISRTSASDLLRSMSISKARKKGRKLDFPGAEVHEHAIGFTQGEFRGAKASLNVWNPNVVGDDFFMGKRFFVGDDYSLSQIWVIAEVPTHAFQTLEAGWHVYPSLNKDNNSRLFIYWTSDGYGSTGCYNLRCSGFVQTNTRIALGASFYPISAYNDAQYVLDFLIWKDSGSGDWWLRVGGEVMGYWPQSLFKDLRDHATLLEYGGEVAFQNSGKHTSTQMGSGHFSNEGFGRATFAINLEIVEKDNRLKPVSNLNVYATKPNCYDVKSGYNNAWGNYIFFGGPGNNPNCP